MEILSAKYLKTNKSIQVKLKNEQEMSVPVNEGNRNYKILLEWVGMGGIIEEYVSPTERTIEEEYMEIIEENSNKVLKSFITAINNGSFIPRSNYTLEQIQNIIKNNI